MPSNTTFSLSPVKLKFLDLHVTRDKRGLIYIIIKIQTALQFVF